MDSILTLADPEAVGVSSAALARIDRALADMVAAGELAGVSILVARHGRLIHRSKIGLKDLASGEPLADDTPVPHLLHDQAGDGGGDDGAVRSRAVAPDDPIRRHLPELAEVKGPDGAPPDPPPTMQALIAHTACFGYGIGPGPHDATDAAYIGAGVWQADGLADFARRVASVPLAYPPGSAWRYSLSADLQGAIIERLTGMSLPDFMQQTCSPRSAWSTPPSTCRPTSCRDWRRSITSTL